MGDVLRLDGSDVVDINKVGSSKRKVMDRDLAAYSGPKDVSSKECTFSKEDERYADILEIALKISKMRKEANLTQKDLAGLIGVSVGRISQMENPTSSSPASLFKLMEIARVCGVRKIRLNIK